LNRVRETFNRWLSWRWRLPPDDLLRDRAYRRLFSSILISSLGGQVSMLALPLTAALLLKASPVQMGLLTAFELLPFVLLSLPAGVWLDRVRKLPVYVAGEALLAVALATVPLAWWAGWLTMPWMYAVGFVLGSVHVVAGTAAQIVLTQVVPRERLVEAHAKNALASSGSEVVGPGLAGALIKAVSAPVALLIDALALLFSVVILRGLRVVEVIQPVARADFVGELKAGLRFVLNTPLLVALAVTMGLWQMCHYAAVVVQILFATRTLGMSEADVGVSFVGLGVGTVAASVWGKRLSAAWGVGPALVVGLGVAGVGWCLCSVAPVSAWGPWMFAAMLLCFGFGAVLTFINFLALRQAVTPAPLLGRMTSTMRWLMLLPAGPGALLGGWLGEHVDLRAALAFAGVGSLLVAGWAWHNPVVRGVRTLPSPAALPQGVGDKVGAAPPPAAGLAEPDVNEGAAKSGPPRP
jgi:MFS family permease